MASGETERSILDTIEKERERHLLINLENIDYLHSSGIRMILSLKMKLEETGRSLLLSNINGDIRKILEFVDILDLIRYSKMKRMPCAVAHLARPEQKNLFSEIPVRYL